MRKRFPSFSLSSYGAGWSANRRIAIVASILAVLLAIAGIIALLTGGRDGHPAPDAAAPAPAHSPSSSEPAPKPSSGSGSVPTPPQIAEPVAYAKAAAQMLWSYDTRDTSRDQQLAGMRAWMTTETRYADWASVSGQVPDPVLWSRMADQDQHATAHVTEGHYPSAFKQALADDPSAITEAYIYVVTVNGKQQIAWKKGGGGAEERAVTLAVQCRPNHDCTLAAIAPSVTQ
ncbi:MULTISPECIES: hypothetical protein [Streptomyces]|uniref:Secreted protein n=6 Tax=Streptomyces TaxID=1883 RepID=A0ABW9I9D5_STRGJ|nr:MULTISPECIES: hypothetical protein [Streptomyces]MBP5861425.1 hypothetical protein [Streptomyces sp. LBUM 1484]MBP5869642.1 hypothetical protein [Streptomyces sp. LBUM 1485]MBP5908054.1 hypothetical protein [Streptomyces sp. LBUM 1478]MBP5928966.1 hypothetical protein [Streptomyces sp. LBUM 1479]KFG02917.1 hypothetical protein IQ61_43930 [Streptomyces scabiei]